MPGTPDDGSWAEWAWDGHEFVARVDPVGFRHLYWTGDATFLAISPSLPALLPHLRTTRLDDDAVAVLLRLGHLVGDDTPFAEARLVPPGGELRWRPGHLVAPVARRFMPVAHPGGHDEQVERVARAYRAAIEASTPGAHKVVAMPLSGGLDSRLMLLELLRLGIRPRFTVTAPHVPPRRDDDLRFAPAIAAHAGVEHRVLSRPRQWFDLELRKNALLGWQVPKHAWQLPIADALAEGGATWIAEGINGGSTLCRPPAAGIVDPLLQAGRFREAAVALLPAGDGIGRGLHRAAARRWGRERAVERLARELSGHTDAPDPYRSYHFYSRIRRFIALAPFGVYASRVGVVATPFITRIALEGSLGVPSAHLESGSLKPEVVRRLQPEVARLPVEHTAMDGTDGYDSLRRTAAAFAAWALPRLAASSPLRRDYVLRRLARFLLDRRAVAEVHGGVALMTLVFQLAELEGA